MITFLTRGQNLVSNSDICNINYFLIHWGLFDFKCRCVTWRAPCVESLFPLLLCDSLCSDMFLSPSPKFPSFRERSEARDCDLPWGWVKPPPHHHPLPSLRDGLFLSISLFCIHLSPLFSLGSSDRVQKELVYPVSSSISDCSHRSISAPQSDCMESLCVEKKKRGKKSGNFTESSDHAAENKANPMDYGAHLCGYIFQNMFMEFLKKRLSLPGSRKFRWSQVSKVAQTVHDCSLLTHTTMCFDVDRPPSSSTPCLSLAPVLHVCWLRGIFWSLQEKRVALHATVSRSSPVQSKVLLALSLLALLKHV